MEMIEEALDLIKSREVFIFRRGLSHAMLVFSYIYYSYQLPFDRDD